MTITRTRATGRSSRQLSGAPGWGSSYAPPRHQPPEGVGGNRGKGKVGPQRGLGVSLSMRCLRPVFRGHDDL